MISKDEICKRQLILTETKQALKQEFIGIDPVIDRLVKTISRWFLSPFRNPFIINVWGMTAIGKIALIFRLPTLIDFDKDFFNHDMNEGAKQSVPFIENLQGVVNNNSRPGFLQIDELQQRLTINEEIASRMNDYFAIIAWNLLDASRTSRMYNKAISKIIKAKQFCDAARSAGVLIESENTKGNNEILIELANHYFDAEHGCQIIYDELLTSPF